MAQADPFFTKSFSCRDKGLQIRAHALTILRDKTRQPGIMVAVAVAQDKSLEPLGLDPEKLEISHQDLGRVTEIEKIFGRQTRTVGFEMQRQPPFARQS